MARLAARNSERVKIAAVAEQDPKARAKFQEEFGVPGSSAYKSCKDLLQGKSKLDAALVTTQPDAHAEPACALLEAGIPVFLEKPVAADMEDAARIVKSARRTGTPLQTGFNCRYAPFFEKIRDIVASGQIGEILSLEWKEIIGPHHWATYCRYPSYNRRSVIGSWLIEKCCHDLDLMSWITGSLPARVASFGSRSFFNPRSDVPGHCDENCPVEKECMFCAFRLHPELKKDPGSLPRFHTLCVYNSGSDLVDHQTAMLEYSNGMTAVFSLMPLIQEHQSSRFVYICGTRAALHGDFEKNRIRLFPHENKKKIICDVDAPPLQSHGGGDSRIISAFLDYLDDSNNQPLTGMEEGWEAMVTGCGIDLSLREHRVVELDALRNVLEEE